MFFRILGNCTFKPCKKSLAALLKSSKIGAGLNQKGNNMNQVTVFNGLDKSKAYQATVVAFKDGLTFVEHPIYGDEAPIQIVQRDRTLKPSHAWDVDSVYDGDY